MQFEQANRFRFASESDSFEDFLRDIILAGMGEGLTLLAEKEVFSPPVISLTPGELKVFVIRKGPHSGQRQESSVLQLYPLLHAGTESQTVRGRSELTLS